MEIVNFNDTLISFDLSTNMINATDMLIAFPNKRMNNFLRLEQTKLFINVLELNTPKSVIKKEIGRYGGTYMNRLLAYKFASWLSPEFELFVYSVFDNQIQKEIKKLQDSNYDKQKQLDYFWDKSDMNDIYK